LKQDNIPNNKNEVIKELITLYCTDNIIERVYTNDINDNINSYKLAIENFIREIINIIEIVDKIK